MLPNNLTWTEEQDNILKKYYGKIYNQDLVKMPPLSSKTIKMIEYRAGQLNLRSELKWSLYKDIKLDFFKNHNIESIYWSGFLVADGALIRGRSKKQSYRLHVKLAIKDEAHLQKFQKAIGHTGKLGHSRSLGGEIRGRIVKPVDLCFLNICQAGKFIDDLAKLGIVPQKTKRIEPPQLKNDVLRLAFFAGIWDGDGHISVTKEDRLSMGIVSSCKTILIWLKELMDRLFPISYTHRQFTELSLSSESGAWQYALNGQRALRIVDIVSRIGAPTLDRKWRQPRLLEMIEESKLKHPDFWSIRLPIEDEIDAFLQKNPVTSSPLITSAPLPSAH